MECQGGECECIGWKVDVLLNKRAKLADMSILLSDETVLVADSEDKFYRLVSRFGRVCEMRMLRVHASKMSNLIMEVCRWKWYGTRQRCGE